MAIRILRFITLVLAALAMTGASAHVLEMPQKMQYNAELYAVVNTTLYQYFALIGGPYQFTSIVGAIVLTILVRKHRPAFGWTLAGTICLLAALGVWMTVVAPVNIEVMKALQSVPHVVPDVWLLHRHRWEYGHVASFIVQLIGFSMLLVSTLVETPRRWTRNSRPAHAV